MSSQHPAEAASPRRVAIVGTGHRAHTYTEALARRDHVALVALCDPNGTRMAVHNRILTGAGRPAASTWQPADFATMLDREQVDTVVVTTPDFRHDEYIVPALEAGLRVITEKPMTTTVDKCRRILETVRSTGNHPTVTFNYRFNPVHAKVRELIAEGAIGDVLSVHFEWVLDVRHGADYFRRWHRDKANSGGLMAHKSSHHFDLVNWWLAAVPETVFGFGRLAFYGKENGTRTGYARDYVRAHGAPEAADDPFALDLADNPGLKALYLDAEHEDGYQRDQNVFGNGITIEDDMAVVVRYTNGATMSYHLNTYGPWEGYRVMFNGTRGRLELEVEESTWAPPKVGVNSSRGALHGDVAAPNAGGARILVRPLWSPSEEVPLTYDHAGHGGADQRMTSALFDEGVEDPLAMGADERDGALALAVGLAANESFVTGTAVNIKDVVDV